MVKIKNQRARIVLGSLLTIALLLSCVTKAQALFNYEVKLLSQDEIKKLSDDDLKEAYIGILIEIEAQNVFYQRAGFSSPNEYNKYKDLIRNRVDLMFELQARQIEIPKINP